MGSLIQQRNKNISAHRTVYIFIGAQKNCNDKTMLPESGTKNSFTYRYKYLPCFNLYAISWKSNGRLNLERLYFKVWSFSKESHIMGGKKDTLLFDTVIQYSKTFRSLFIKLIIIVGIKVIL